MTGPSAAERAARRLSPLFGDRLTANETVRDHHAHGEGWRHPDQTLLPAYVLFARTTQDVSDALRICHEENVPVIPFGGGTSLEGQLTPVPDCISLDLSMMTDILDVSPENLTCRVQAGVTRQDLNLHLRTQGLFFPVDPGGEATFGGMCATRASGTGAMRYGTMRANVLGLTAVLADGPILHTGGAVRKAATGYDLTGLLIGSEGTLAVITEVQAQLHPIPEAVGAAVCQFPTLASAVETAVLVIQCGLTVGRMELLDDVQMDACIQYSHLTGYEALPTMFFELTGSPASVAEQETVLRDLVAGQGGQSFRWATATEERNTLWKARHDAFWACMAYRPGYRGITTDAIVPIAALTELMTGARADIDASGLLAPIVGHVGDGNFHTVILIPPNDADAEKRALELDHKIIRRALSLGGSASGEHGIGLAKQIFMTEEHEPAALSVMRAIKSALDPKNILNPGKLVPADVL
ncbi:FAD-binding oxidoreductase [Gluconobacter oxydans]|uniref:FAD-binding oxidoreductase n=1 Tax=Gluconobacter oxydans TaxID=442 RepID=UPI0039E9CDE0